VKRKTNWTIYYFRVT